MSEPILVSCSEGLCGYNALGVIATVTLDDLPETEFLTVTLSPRPILEDGSADDADDLTANDTDDSAYFCRHHLIERVENHLRHASRQAPARVWA